MDGSVRTRKAELSSPLVEVNTVVRYIMMKKKLQPTSSEL